MSQLIMKHPEFQPENVKFDTVEVHAGEPRDPYGSLIPPIYQTSTFYFDSTDDAVEACSDYAESFAYSRITNPSLDYMEQMLAALEHGKGAVSYASGMGAVAGALFAALQCGDHVIFTKAKYSGTEDITSDWLPRFGIEHDSFRADHLEELEPLIKPNTKVIYVETPANPTMVLEGFNILHDETGVKRRKNIPASENLIKLLKKGQGEMFYINTAVDIYNLLSLESKLALGAHNIDKVDGNVTLRFTDGSEKFVPLGQTEPVPVAPHEYCYCDDSNEVLCRLEIRQVNKTAVDETAKNVFYIVQGNKATPDELLWDTARKLIAETEKYCGGSGEIVVPKII